MDPIDNLRLGASSWSAPDWKGVFYSPGATPADFIVEYARKYSTVEIDATFYRIPSRKTVEAWRDRTPEGFLFAAKMPQAITHEKFLVDCQEETAAFLSAMSLLRTRLGPLLLQFPYFAKRANVGAEDFIARLGPYLDALPTSEFQFAVEVRNKAWIAPPLLQLLAKHNVPLALIDHPWMHRPGALFRRDDILTGPFVYIRWLGDRRAIEELTQCWNKTVIDRRKQMEEWIDPVRALLERNLRVYAYVNNHYSGYAPADIDRFTAMIRRALANH